MFAGRIHCLRFWLTLISNRTGCGQIESRLHSFRATAPHAMPKNCTQAKIHLYAIHNATAQRNEFVCVVRKVATARTRLVKFRSRLLIGAREICKQMW